jgi:pyrroline-5-carboxylate reductase
VDPFNFTTLNKKYLTYKVKLFNETPTQVEIKKYDIIIFAVKPQAANKVIEKYKNFKFKKNSVIVSIIAGKKILFFKKNIKNIIQLVRVMPNMPALINQGISCLIGNKNFSKANQKKVNKLFLKVGETIWLDDEKQIDMATAISGSGPGYIFTLIDAFEKASQKIGFSKEVSRALVLSTFLGSANLMRQTNKEPDYLANSIAVKGGTTEAGIKILRKKNINKIIYDTFIVAYKKAIKLGKEND